MNIFSKLKLKYKISLLVILIIFISSIIYSTLMYYEIRSNALKEIDQKLLIAVELTKHTIPSNYHDKILTSASITPKEYQEIIKKHDTLCRKHNLEYLWSLIKLNDKIRFTSCTSQDKNKHKNHVSFFEPHSNPAAFNTAFKTMKPQYTILKDKWGTVRSVLIPYYDSSGRKYLFGASVSLEQVNRALNSFLIYNLIILVVLLIAGCVVSIVLSHSIAAPIYQLIEKTKVVALGNFDEELETSGTHELSILSKHFNLMITSIKQKIDEVQKAEAKAKITSQTLESFIDVIPHVFYSFKIDGQIIIWNKTLEKETGYTKAEIIQMKATDFFTAEDVPTIEASIKRVIENGSDTVVSKILTKDKKEIPFSFSGNILTLEDKTPYAIVGVGTNISIQVEAEQQLKEQAQKLTEAAHNNRDQNKISKEFINSVNKILTYSEHITETSKNESDNTTIEDAENINKYSLNLLQQINKFFKSSNNKSENNKNE